MNNKDFKLKRGASFLEFYYTGLMIDSSSDLVEYIKANKWYFDRMNDDVQEQFREKHKNLKRLEERNKWAKE